MDVEQLDSGLVIPKQTPQRRYGPLEIQDEEHRKLASEALTKLWHAMDLSSGGVRSIIPPENSGAEAYDVYHKLYSFVGEMLLGDECPEYEVLT